MGSLQYVVRSPLQSVLSNDIPADRVLSFHERTQEYPIYRHSRLSRSSGMERDLAGWIRLVLCKGHDRRSHRIHSGKMVTWNSYCEGDAALVWLCSIDCS